MFCGKCGSERTNEHARFCRVCGATFHTSLTQPTSLAQSTPEQLDGLGEATTGRSADDGGLPVEQGLGPADFRTSAADYFQVGPAADPFRDAGQVWGGLDDQASAQHAPIHPTYPPPGAAPEQTPTALGTMSAPTRARVPLLLVAALGLLLVGGIIGYVAVTWPLPL